MDTIKNSGDKAFGNLFDNVKPVFIAFNQVDVKITAKSEVFKAFSLAYLNGIKDKLSLAGGGLPVEEDQVKAYLEYAVYAAVTLQDHDSRDRGALLWKRHDTFYLPAFLGVFIAQIGVVNRPEIGIRLKPVWSGEPPKITRDGLVRVSGLLQVLENHGFEMMRGLPRVSEGSWQMMSMIVVEQHVLSTTPEHHPSYAVMAAFFGVTGLQETLGSSAYRVRYASEEQIKSFAVEVTHGAKARA